MSRLGFSSETLWNVKPKSIKKKNDNTLIYNPAIKNNLYLSKNSTKTYVS